MRNVFIAVGALLFLGGVGGSVWWLQAAPQRSVSSGAATSSAQLLQAAPPAVLAPTAKPNIITVGSSTQVVFAVSIPDPNVTGVNLLRFNANGSTPIAATMLDNGQNGDQTAGDKVFTARLTLNELQAGEVKFQVSAAFRGVLRRSVSPPLALPVWLEFDNQVLGIQFNTPSDLRPSVRPSGTGGADEVALINPSAVSDLGVSVTMQAFSVPVGITTLHEVVILRLGSEAIISESVLLSGVLVSAKTLWSNHFFQYDSGRQRAVEISSGNSSFFHSQVFAQIISSLRF